jgi:hypothetical protein
MEIARRKRLATGSALALALALAGVTMIGTVGTAAAMASAQTVAHAQSAAQPVADAAMRPVADAGQAVPSGGTTLVTHRRARVVVFDCQGHALVRPARFILACADGNALLTHLHWSTWGPLTAWGWGVEWVNSCRPNCVKGTFHHHKKHVLLWRIRPVRHHHHEYRFTRLTVGHATYHV